MHGLQEIVEMNEAATEAAVVGVDNVRETIAKGIVQFLKEPPRSGVQIGFLAALVHVAREMHEDFTAYPYRDAEALLEPKRVPPAVTAPHSVLPHDHPARNGGEAGPCSVLPPNHPARLHIGRHSFVEKEAA